MSELDAEGISLAFIKEQYTGTLRNGDTGPGVEMIQYYLRFIGTFNDFIPAVTIDGVFGDATENSVRSFQQAYGLEQTGVVNEETWNRLYSTYFRF